MSGQNLKKIALVSGAKIQNTLQDTTFHSTFGLIFIGEAEEIFVEEIAGNDLLFIKGCRLCPASSILLRGATGYLLDEISRSIYDAICIVKKALEGYKLVTGGGSVEISIYSSLNKLSNSIPTREQLGLLEFAEAVLIIPKMLAINSGLNQAQILSKLKILHTAFVELGKHEFKYFGVDLLGGKVQNHLINGVFEPAVSKIKSLQIATEAAITLLRIDDLITAKKKM